MIEPSFNLGDGNWAGKSGNLLGYHKISGNFYADDLTFTRASTGTIVNAEGLIESVGSGMPRVDYLNNANGSLLLEGQRTNGIVNSNVFTSWFKSGTVTVTANYGVSPTGETNSSLVNFAAASNRLYLSSGLSYANDTISIYVKGVSGETISFGKASSIGVGALFVLTGEWQRLVIENLSSPGVNIVLGTNTFATAREIEVFGVQDESGSYATSYIPTSGTTVTRLADACSQTGLSNAIGQTEGTIFLDFKVLSEDEINANIFNTNKNTTNAIAVIRTKSIKKIQVQTFFNSVIVSYSATNTYDVGDRIKLAFKYKNGDVKLYINGILENSATPTFTISSSLSEINLADNVTYFARKEGVDYTSLQIFKTALTDTELATLTTI